MKPKAKDEAVKCTVKLPAELWKAARIQALTEGRDFQDVVAEALERYLKQKGAKS